MFDITHQLSFIEIFASDLEAADESYPKDSSVEEEIGAVIAKCIQSYAKKFSSKSSLAEECYHEFFKNLPANIRKDFVQKKKTAKSLNELKKRYYGNVINQIRTGQRKELAPALHYWFHAYAEDKGFAAAQIDKRVLEIYPKLTETLNEITARITRERLVSEKEESAKSQFKTTSYNADYHPTSDFLISPLTNKELLYLNKQAPVEFMGRDHELQRLEDFAKHSVSFSIWGIRGPSGAGKTRLVIEWMLSSQVIQNWHRYILSELESTRSALWERWSPTHPTLIVIDCMFGVAEGIKTIIQRCRNGFPYPVRLLIIDHILPDDLRQLMREPHFGFSGMGVSLLLIDDLFFDNEPLELRQTSDQDNIIRSIIKELAGQDINDAAVEAAEHHLQKEKNAWYPLFAVLIGDALKQGRDYRALNRRALISGHLEGNQRLPWNQEGTHGKWASAFIAAATARRGVSFSLLTKCIPEQEVTLKEGYGPIRHICKRIVSTNMADHLPSFEPDMLGETFFLLFLEGLEDASPIMRKQFIEMLSVGDNNEQTQVALNFIGFIERLARNLSNDDQSDTQTFRFWKLLLGFLNPQFFPAQSQMRGAVSIAIAKIRHSVNAHSLNEYYSLLECLDIDALLGFDAKLGSLNTIEVLAYAIDYCEWVDRDDNQIHVPKNIPLNIISSLCFGILEFLGNEFPENVISANRLSADISHEIRTPLNAVLGLVSLLGQERITPIRRKEFLRILKMSAQCLIDLINNVQDITQLEAGQLQLQYIPFDLVKALDEVMQINQGKADERAITLDLKKSTAIPLFVFGDPFRFKQVCENLIGNAIKFTSEGSVAVDLSCTASSEQYKVMMAMEVLDTGIGVPADKIETIFAKCTQANSSIARRYGGNGMGLFIAQSLVKLMMGTIELESVEGKSSRFTVRIPFRTNGQHV